MGTGRRFADRQGKTGKVNPAHVFEQFLTHIVLTAGGGGRVRNGFRHVREAYGFSFARDSVCRIVGGGTASKLWVQILADITGVKLECMRDGVEAPMGDAFMAGLLYAYLHRFLPERAARWALAAGTIAVTSAGTVSPGMSAELVNKILEENEL